MVPSVVGSLKRNVSAWRDIGANEEVLSWISDGIKLPFTKTPDRYECVNHKFSSEQVRFLDTEINKLLKSGAVSRSVNKPHCVNALGCVPKKNKSFRLIVDLRPLNVNIQVPYFKNEGIDVVCDSLLPNDEFVSIDLKDGFHHLSIHPEHRRYLGFQWKKQYYVFNVLPFGCNVSPYYFNKTIRTVVQFLRQNDLRFSSFVDDGLLSAQPDDIERQTRFLINTYTRLGLVINYEKSELVHKPEIVFIGYVINSKGPDGNPWISIPKSRIHKLQRDIKRVLNRQKATARVIAKICGQCISFTKAIVPTKLLLRNLYRLLSTRKCWSDILCLDIPSVKDLEWWLVSLNTWNGRPVVKRQIDIQLFTDASDSGWGGVCDNNEAAGHWTPEVKQTSINYRELLAVLLSLKSFKDIIANKCVQILTDNVTTVACINNLGGNVPELTALTKSIYAHVYQNNIQIHAKHLAGKVNCHADRLSRLSPESTYSWKLHPTVFALLNRKFKGHTIDRFADITNFKVPIYNSLYWDPLTSGVDALAQKDWALHNNFVNPPIALIPKILDIIIAQRADATIIAPHWPAQPWYRTLRTIATAYPLPLPLTRDLCEGRNPEPLKNPKWRFSAWRVSGKTHCVNKVGQNQQQK